MFIMAVNTLLPTKLSLPYNSPEAKYADIILGWCLGVKPKERVLIETMRPGTSMAITLQQRVSDRDAFADVHVIDEKGYDHAVLWMPKRDFKRLVHTDAHIYANYDVIINLNASNTKYPKNARTERIILPHKFGEPIDRVLERRRHISAGYPTQLDASENNMTYEDIRKMFFSAVFYKWERRSEELKRINERLNDILAGTNEIRIVTPKGTDLTFSIGKNHVFLIDDGKSERGPYHDSYMPGNTPAGEFFISPVPETGNGALILDIPTVYSGIEVRDVSLEVKDGKVKIDSIRAKEGQAFLQQLLSLDKTAPYLSEMGIGLNPYASRVTPRGEKRLLGWEEKIDGTLHFAMGENYPHCGVPEVNSMVHIDIPMDTRKGGRITVISPKGKRRIIYEHGKFTPYVTDQAA